MAATSATRAQGPPKVLLDRKGDHVYNLEAVLARFSEHFVGVLGGGRHLIDEVWEHMDAAVKNVEGVLLAQGDSTRVTMEPTLAEV
jgi:hypothetical protein